MRTLNFVFDLDGTLVDTEYTIAYFTSELAKSKGCALDVQAAFCRFAGVSFKDKFNTIGGSYGRSFSEEELKAMHVEYTAKKVEMYKGPEIPMIPNARALLKRLTSKLPSSTFVLASSNETKRSRAVLSSTGLSQYFGERVYGSDMAGGLKKPHPGIHLLAINDNPNTVVIEDSIPGVQGAAAAKAPFIVAFADPRLNGSGKQRREEYMDAGADIVIDDYRRFDTDVLPMLARTLQLQH